MGKLIMMSAMIVNIAAPILAAREPNPHRGVRRMFLVLLAFDLVYSVVLARIYSRYYYPVWRG